jgi:hypothetical protein
MQRSTRISLKNLPAVSRLLASRPLAPLIRRYGPGLVTDLLREALEGLRSEVRSGRLQGAELRRAISHRAIAAVVAREAEDLLTPRPRPVRRVRRAGQPAEPTRAADGAALPRSSVRHRQ